MPHLPHRLLGSRRAIGEPTSTARAAERWRAAHPGGTVTYRDLATDPIPHLVAGTARRGTYPPSCAHLSIRRRLR